MHALKTLVAAVAASLSLQACASAGGSQGALDLADGPSAGSTARAAASNPSSSASATLHVENFNWMDVVVYAVQGTRRIRLGQVTSMGSGNFRIPERFLSSSENVRLMVDPVGSTEGYMTEGIAVRDGQRVSFSVQNALQFSSVQVGGR
ncbi:MAG TPA: hypothetical protein VF541_01280 [Longimicrobium sp.]|jgi:hypothetical protein